MMALAPFLVWGALAGSSAAAFDTPARVVVIVGYNGGAPDPRAPLSFADDDAARLFLQLAPGAERGWLLTTFDKESARAFPELSEVARPPTKDALAGALGEAFWLLRQQKERGRKTELVFAFAGHGDVDDGGQGFVVFGDGAFTRADLARQVLVPSPADINHVIVDACSSYFFVKSRGAEQGENRGVPLTPALLDALKDPLPAALIARTGLLVSTSQAKEVHESRALSAGVFSYLLRSALTGGGDVDGDGRIEYGEAAAFLGAASQSIDDPRARLQVFAEPPLQRPHSALLDLRHSGASSFLAIDEPGRVRLLDARGVPWAEVNSDRERPVYLSLVGQPFFLVQRDGAEAVLVPRSGGAYALSSLDFSAAPTARGDGGGPFARLFERPLNEGFVSGFFASQSLAAPLTAEPFAPPWSLAGSPPLRLPVGLVGGTIMGGAAVAGVGAAAAVIGNQLAFQQLEQSFGTSGQIDPALSLQVEGWRNAATALTATAVVLGIAGGGLVLWSLSLKDGEVALP